jgi:hypothetical protein
MQPTKDQSNQVAALDAIRDEDIDLSDIPEQGETAIRSEGAPKPTCEVNGAVLGKVWRVFSDEERLELTERVHWLRAAEPAFEFWNNDADAIYDQL